MLPLVFLKSLKPLAGRALSYAVALGTLSGWLLIAQAWMLANVVDQVIFHQAGLDEVSDWLAALLALFLLRALLAWTAEQVAFSAAAAVKQQLRERLYRHLQALGPAVLGGERSGAVANTLSDGIEAIEAYFARYLPAISLMALVPLSILVFVLPTDWLSGLILLVTAPLIPFFMILIGKGAERLNQKQWRKLAQMSGHFLDVIQGLTTLKLFNASRREAITVAQMSEHYRRDTMAVLRVAFLSSLTLEFLATVSIALVAVTVGFRLFWGELDFLHGFFVLLLAPEFYLPLRNMGTQYHARMEAVGAVDEMIRILETPLPDTPAASATAPSRLAAPTLQWRDVHFSYEEGRQALQGFSLDIAAGERVALVGSSGAGKSTLLNMLLGFVLPQQGEFRVNAESLAALPRQQWWAQVAWVPQRPQIFAGSLLDNIRLGMPEASLEQVQAAAAQARADEFIERLPLGYDSPVGEMGQGLSGGQIQRIALARAFLKDAPLVLLDEATAHLDRHNEMLVSAAIERLAQGRTLVMIAHRLETVKRADRIVVMQQGRVAEQGTYAQLLAANGLFARLLAAEVLA